VRRNQKWFGEESILQQRLATRLDPSLTRDVHDTSTGYAVASSCAENNRHRIVSDLACCHGVRSKPWNHPLKDSPSALLRHQSLSSNSPLSRCRNRLPFECYLTQSFLSSNCFFSVQRNCSSFTPHPAILSNVIENAPFCFSQSSIIRDPLESLFIAHRWFGRGTSKNVDRLRGYSAFNVSISCIYIAFASGEI